jgi:hypothetical protein
MDTQHLIDSAPAVRVLCEYGFSVGAVCCRRAQALLGPEQRVQT